VLGRIEFEGGLKQRTTGCRNAGAEAKFGVLWVWKVVEF
jgi:hypothetical protein